MLRRRHLQPEDHWAPARALPFRQGLRCGDMIFVAGQTDLDWQGRVRHPSDPAAQVRGAMRRLLQVLEGLGAEARDLVRLTVFHVPAAGLDEATLLAELAACLDTGGAPGPVVVPVPLPTLAVHGLSIEIEAIAMRGAGDEGLPRVAAWCPGFAPLPAPFSQALRCGGLVFTGGLDGRDEHGDVAAPGSLAGQSRLLLPRLGALLAELGCSLADVVKTDVWNVEPGHARDWAEGARIRASHYPQADGPAATGISLPALGVEGLMLRNALVAVPGSGVAGGRSSVWPEGHWDWTVPMPYRHGVRCGDLVWLGGQVSLRDDGTVVDPDDMPAQTRRAMGCIARVLEGFGLGLANVVKLNAFYAGGAGLEVLRSNLDVRAAAFAAPGPVSTGVPVPWLAYERMVVEIDVWAMA